jgi:hypothetical protein
MKLNARSGLISLLAASALATGALTVAPAVAQQREHHRPPQAAFDACTGKESGAACSVTFGERTITGTCDQTPEDKLACRPDHPQGLPPDPNGPPRGDEPPAQR